MDGNTPPIYIVYDEVVSGGDYETDRRTVVVTVSLFLVVVALYVARELLFPLLLARWTSTEQRQKELLDQKLNAERFTTNFHAILTSCVSLTFSLTEVRKRPTKIIPHLFVVLWVIAIIVINDGISSRSPDTGLPLIKSPQTQAGLILFFIAVNGFLIDRILSYYQDRTELRKKAQAAHAVQQQRASVVAATAAAGASAGTLTAPAPPELKLTAPPPNIEIVVSDAAQPAADSDEGSAAGPASPTSVSFSGVRGSSLSVDTQIELTSITGTADRGIRGPRPISTMATYGEPPTPNDTMPTSKQAHKGSLSDTSEFFDNSFRYRRRIKHISPQFKRIDFTFANTVELLVLITEFIQLCSFPLRDLLRSVTFQQSLLNPATQSSVGVVTWIRQIASTISVGLPSINTRFLTTVQFAISWWALLGGLVVAVVFTMLYHLLRIELFEKSFPPTVLRRIRQIVSGTWIMIPLPLINLFYLIILTAFVDPLGCLTDNHTPLWPARSLEEYAVTIQARERQCLPIHDGNPPLQTGYSLAGFMMGYLLLTICRTAQEPVPRDGAIQYTSRSELLFKNSAVVLLLIYVLVPSEKTTGRGIFAIFVLAAMIVYSVLIGSSYTRIVNVIRTISFMCVLWLVMVVVYYTSDAQETLLGNTGSAAFNPVLIGWAIIAVVYTAAYMLFIRQLQKDSQLPRLPPSVEDLSGYAPIPARPASRDELKFSAGTSLAPIRPPSPSPSQLESHVQTQIQAHTQPQPHEHQLAALQLSPDSSRRLSNSSVAVEPTMQRITAHPAGPRPMRSTPEMRAAAPDRSPSPMQPL
ncbi:hypothetical protein HK105_203992 [Polyrhizophydium stewartii]|uniref:Transmembrane protein n=1 Tax=Polyrhizophydium stewartii TaxID=2732419 RepID=A0ABR4NAQ5_9FUNG